MRIADGYRLLEDGRFQCTDCEQASYNGMLRHSSRCDVAPRKSVSESHVILADPEEANEAKPALKNERPSIQTAAKAGNLRSSGYSDDEIVGAVRCGAISESSAMNQDD